MIEFIITIETIDIVNGFPRVANAVDDVRAAPIVAASRQEAVMDVLWETVDDHFFLREVRNDKLTPIAKTIEKSRDELLMHTLACLSAGCVISTGSATLWGFNDVVNVLLLREDVAHRFRDLVTACWEDFDRFVREIRGHDGVDANYIRPFIPMFEALR